MDAEVLLNFANDHLDLKTGSASSASFQVEIEDQEASFRSWQ